MLMDLVSAATGPPLAGGGLLLAVDIGTVLQALIVLVPVVLWALSQIFGEAAAKKGPPARRPRPPRPAAGNRPPDLTAEIEQFLRRAAEKRGDKPPAEVEVVVPEPPARRLVTPPQRPVAAEVVAKKKSDGPLSRRLAARHEVSEHVRTHLDTQDITEHAAHLGEKVGLADEKIEARIHRKFDHQVGRLRKEDQSQPYARPSERGGSSPPALTASALSAMLGDPQSVRQAVILSEILRSPIDDE